MERYGRIPQLLEEWQGVDPAKGMNFLDLRGRASADNWVGFLAVSAVVSLSESENGTKR